MESLRLFWLVCLGLYGLLFGSLANVIIWRVPRGESIVTPGSHCPACAAAIRWYDNIPVVSWVFLRARCRACGSRISARYPLVETLSGALWVLAGLAFGMTPRMGFAVAFFYLLLVLTFIDLDHLRLPNGLVAVLAGVGVLGIVLSSLRVVSGLPLVPLPAGGLFASPIAYAALGILLGAGVSGLIAALYSLARGAVGLGMGDMKLLGAMGLFLGPYSLMVLVVGSVLGTIGSLVLIARGAEASKTRIPFGPFLAAAAVLVTLAGPALWSWYVGLVGL